MDPGFPGDTSPLHAGELGVINALGFFAELGGESTVVERGSGVLAVAASGRSFGAYHTGAVRCSRRVPAQDAIESVQAFSRRTGRPMLLWASERSDGDILVRADELGLDRHPDVVAMAATRPARPPDPVRGVSVVLVSNVRQAADFAEVHRLSAQSAGRDPSFADYYSRPSVLLHPSVSAFVVYAHSTAVSCAMSLAQGAISAIYWVATVPGARRNGYARIAADAAFNAGCAGGGHAVFLQSTQIAAPIYRSLGFVELFNYRRYQVGTPIGLSRP